MQNVFFHAFLDFKAWLVSFEMSLLYTDTKATGHGICMNIFAFYILQWVS